MRPKARRIAPMAAARRQPTRASGITRGTARAATIAMKAMSVCSIGDPHPTGNRGGFPMRPPATRADVYDMQQIMKMPPDKTRYLDGWGESISRGGFCDGAQAFRHRW